MNLFLPCVVDASFVKIKGVLICDLCLQHLTFNMIGDLSLLSLISPQDSALSFPISE